MPLSVPVDPCRHVGTKVGPVGLPVVPVGSVGPVGSTKVPVGLPMALVYSTNVVDSSFVSAFVGSVVSADFRERIQYRIPMGVCTQFQWL